MGLNAICDLYLATIASNLPTFIGYCVVYGLFNGAYSTGYATVLKDMFGHEHLSIVYGVLHSGIGLGSLILPMIAGQLAGYYQSFTTCFIFNGITHVLGAF